MAEVSKITPRVRQLECPTELRELPGWLVWRSEEFEGESKPRKVPYYVDGSRRHGRQGSPEDRSRLTTFNAAREVAVRKGYDGVGLAMFADWGITALDFDHCVDANGNMPDEVSRIVSKTFAELSPSGKGVRAFVKGNLGNHKSFKDANNEFGVEVFNSSGFVTVTGNLLPFTELLGLDDYIAPVDPEVVALCQKRFGNTRTESHSDDFLDNHEPVLGLKPDEIEAYLSDLDPSMGRDPWIQVGMALSHETAGSEQGFAIWDMWSSAGEQYPGSESLRHQWDSFSRRDPNSRQITMRTVMKMSREARGKRGEPQRTFDPISRAAEDARSTAVETHPDQFVTPPDFDGKFKIVSGHEMSNNPPIRWLIKGVLPRDAEIAVLYGTPGSGKSFQALDMALSLVRGIPWRERKVVKSRVLYVAAEGAAGVAQRLKAYSMHHNVDLSNVPIGTISDAPNLMIEEDASQLVKSIISAGGADLIICDTWAQVTPGANENSGEDMGLALKHARSIRQATGAMILLVAHTGKDLAKGIRGWSGMNAAANTSLEVSRVEDSDVRLLQVTKQKDGRDDLPPWAFKLEEVLIGYDEDGDEICTPVVIETEVPIIMPKSNDRRLTGGKALERLVLDHLPTLVGRTDMTLESLTNSVLDGLPAGHTVQKNILERTVTNMATGRNPAYIVANGLVEFFPML